MDKKNLVPTALVVFFFLFVSVLMLLYTLMPFVFFKYQCRLGNNQVSSRMPIDILGVWWKFQDFYHSPLTPLYILYLSVYHSLL